MKKGLFNRIVIGFCMIWLMVATVGFSGCSGGSGSDETTVPVSGDTENGELILSLTDAAGDFATYTVDVTSITLTRVNGEIVSTLPLTTRVDFAQYSDMTEFLTAATVPNGVYTQATLTLDYQNADIQVEDNEGNLVPVAGIKDEDGNVITTLEVSVYLENANRVVVAKGTPIHLTLDFDLNASNAVVFSADGVPELTVKPILLAEVNPVASKLHRVRGMLGEVSLDDRNFKVLIRPFVHTVSQGNRNFGTITVTTNDDTVYDISGQSYQGQEGLIALNALELDTPVVAFGSVKFDPYRFEAREVRAGDSVPGADMDQVSGNVISRDGNTLILKGASLTRKDCRLSFNDTVTILLGENTVVNRQLSKEAYGINDISVGQRIVACGALTDSVDPLQPIMDATNGHVCMLLTTLRGTVAESGTIPPLTIALESIDKHEVTLFDFLGTGDVLENDADPDHYEINTGTLDVSFFSPSDPVTVTGFVRPFGAAPEDFEAWTVVDTAEVKSLYRISWHPFTTTPFTALSSEGLCINIESADIFHHLWRGNFRINLEDLSGAPCIRPVESGEGMFVVKWHEVVNIHARFDEFVTDLESRLANGRSVKDIFASGTFDDETLTLTSRYIAVEMK